MICGYCAGVCEWRGRFPHVTHTECTFCGATNSQLSQQELGASDDKDLDEESENDDP